MTQEKTRENSRPNVSVVQRNPGCLVQVVWFFLIGWWLGQIWIAVAWALILTVVGIPFAVIMLNRLPEVIALRGQTGLVVKRVGDSTIVSAVPQYNLIIRAIYFVLIGWWLSGLWMQTAYFFCLSIIGLPIGFWMFDWVPMVVSLRRQSA